MSTRPDRSAWPPCQRQAKGTDVITRSASGSLPDELADHLIALIYVGGIAPGLKPPSERMLADILGVDRTAPRLALAPLNRRDMKPDPSFTRR